MSHELAIQGDNFPATQQPFGRSGLIGSPSINAGSVAIEQERAIAEAQGQLILAKKFPRSMAAATAELLEACKSPEFAAQAFYSVPNRGSGPSIRFAEEVARVYGNFQYGHREFSRSEGRSEIEVYAWDMEKNNRSPRQITVMHITDTKNGPKRLTDQTDIDNRIANVASKQMRGRILALVPKHLVALGIAECKKTLTGTNDEPISSRITKMTAAFGKYGVNAQHLAAHVGHSLDDVTVDELADLIGVYNAIKEGIKPSEFFGAPATEIENDGAQQSVDKIKKLGADAPAKTKPAATKQTKAAEPATTDKAPAASAAENSKPDEKPSNPTKEEMASGEVITDAASDSTSEGADLF